MQVTDLYDPREQWASYLINAIKAKELQKLDVNYIVKGVCALNKPCLRSTDVLNETSALRSNAASLHLMQRGSLPRPVMQQAPIPAGRRCCATVRNLLSS